MNALNIDLLRWLAAGDDPSPGLLFTARLLALYGAWACAAAIAWAAWWRRADALYLLTVTVGAGVASLLSHTLAAKLNIARPFVAGWVQAYIAHGNSAALPSTHASVMFFVASALLLRAGLRATGCVMLVLAILVGWARIYVGVHFPLDIFAGAALGSLVAAALALVWHYVAPPRASDARRAQEEVWRAS